PTFRSLPWTLAGMLLTIPLSSGAAASPQDTLRSTIERLVTVLRDPALQGQSHRPERGEKVQEILRSQFAFPEMAHQALGSHWQERTEAERQGFVCLFTALLEQSYCRILERCATEGHSVFSQDRIEMAEAEVDTQVRASAHEQPVEITYRLRDVGGQWLVYDVVIDRVSLVRHYRAQFSRILGSPPFADLVQTIESKLREIEVAPLAQHN